MTSLYECGTCGVVSETDERLCSPHAVNSLDDYCGTNPDRDICDTMHNELSFECSSCGRATEQKELVCHPVQIRR